MVVQLEKKPMRVCNHCTQLFEVTDNPNAKYCGNCTVAGQVIFTWHQALYHRWKIVPLDDKLWVKEVMGIA